MRLSSSRLLRVYPPAWRERYGPELLAVLEAESGSGRIALRSAVDVIGAGLLQRLRSAGLLGDELPPALRARAGLLLVLSSWSVFVVAGIGLQKTAEHWQAVTPAGRQDLPAAAFGGVVVGAAIGSGAVLLAILLATRPLLRLLHSGGWNRLRRTVLFALLCSGLTAATLTGVAVWAHQLTDTQRNGGNWLYGAAFLLLAACAVCSIAAWTRAAVITAKQLILSRTTLRLETFLAAAVTLTMVTMTGATAIWWASVAAASPTFFGSGVPWNMLAVVLTMLAASTFATGGVVRSVRAGGLGPHDS